MKSVVLAVLGLYSQRAVATREQLRALAEMKLREAETLFASGFFDGCAYLCGYVVELALKARICATLGISEYPDKESRLRSAFRTHDLNDLKLLAGMETEISANRPNLLSNWSIATQWKPELRYEPVGSFDRVQAEGILDAIRSKPDGVLICISSRW
jgi:HEPN domain-containing protein